ncbi:MAG: FG-GAP repeat domain-containing protein [Candidatus Kapaibacterium sp.]
MRFSTLHTIFFLPLFGVLLFTSISLQAQNEIVQNPDAVLLRKVWMVRGGVVGGDRVGDGAGGAGDVNHSGQEDFAVLIGSTAEWRVYVDSNKAHTTNPFWKFDSGAGVPWRPIVGNFRGDGDLLVGFTRADIRLIEGISHMTARILFYESMDSLSSQQSPVMILNTATYIDNSSAYPRDIQVADIDNDGDDELILVFGSFLRDLQRIAKAEVWIFEGGSEFQLESPTVVLKDTEENSTRYDAVVGDFDGDHYPDILTYGNYESQTAGRPNKINFWWGKSHLSDLSKNPDRTIELIDPDYPRIGNGLTMLDCDGDGVQDIWLPGPDGYYYLYRMGIEGKDARNRTLRLDDADRTYKMNEYSSLSLPVGTMNDPTGRYEMVGVIGDVQGDIARMGVLSGGKQGPNPTIDGYYSAGAGGMTPGGVFGNGGSVGDVTGSGYNSYLAANPYWFNLEQGIAILLEGGPYIPTDDSTSSVVAVATNEHRAALHIWPNPVVDELHVAWRGDLKAPPSRLRIFDMVGRRVVEQEVVGWRGEALWRCGSVASGSYLLVVYDREERVIAQTTILKQ